MISRVNHGVICSGMHLLNNLITAFVALLKSTMLWVKETDEVRLDFHGGMKKLIVGECQRWYDGNSRGKNVVWRLGLGFREGQNDNGEIIKSGGIEIRFTSSDWVFGKHTSGWNSGRNNARLAYNKEKIV